MKKIIIAPDSYKGTLSALEVAQTISRAVKDVSAEYETLLIPIADGGEGTIEALGAKKIPCTVSGSLFEKVESFWGELGDKAVIELAACAGLPMAKRLDPEAATTFGVGQLISAALDAGKRDFIIALGGSSTNDMGCGMAAALGVKFFNGEGKEFIPTGGTLCDIASIDRSGIDIRVTKSRFVTMCDVDNPLFGEKGAAYVFAPQKGATPEAVQRLDNGLRHAAQVVKSCLDVDVSSFEGAGAAGGCGAGVVAFLDSVLKRGIDVVLDAADFDKALEGCALVFTGEGKFDSQSIDGKAISGIAARTKEKNIPLIVLAGAAEEAENCYDMGVTAVFSIQRKALPFKEARLINGPSLYRTAYNVMKLFDCTNK